MACAQKNHLLLAKNKTFRGREEINLLVHAYCSMLSIFLSFLSNSSFLFIFFLSILLIFVVILSLRLLLLRPPPLCMARVLFIMPAVINFYHFSL